MKQEILFDIKWNKRANYQRPVYIVALYLLSCPEFD